MPARTDSVDRSAPNTHRWLLNGRGRVVDPDADSASWDLVDEIGRLQLADVSADHPDDVRVALRTPPKSKMPSAGVAAPNDASPLDSSSSASVGSSPHVPDHPMSHSRGSSADTSLSNPSDPVNNAALLPHPPLNGAPANNKERPHSFSGGISNADLRRLQQADESDHHQRWAPTVYRDAEQLSYPSLATQAPRPLAPHMFTYPPNVQPHPPVEPDRDEAQLDYSSQQRNYSSIHPHVNHAPLMNPALPGSQFVSARPNGSVPPVNYRPNPRGFPQGAPGQNGVAYTAGHHTPHLSLGNTQQLYEMMLPHDPHHPAVTRVQQQHNVFRPTHHHSASDPSALRDPGGLALLNSTYGANMFQPGLTSAPGMPLYGQYYGAPDIAVQQAMAARQYTGPYGIAAPSPSLPIEPAIGSPTSSAGQATGPSANNRKLGLYKTELCRSWEEKGSCRYGTKCQFAHGEDELRRVARHPKASDLLFYKTEICKTFWVSGSCPYGKRCCFIHTELSSASTPTAGATAEGSPAPQAVDNHRERSNSDPDTSSSVSLLARISQRNQEAAAAAAASSQGSPTPVDMNGSEAPYTSSFMSTKPAMGSLRVNTVLDGPSIKQNKSAYPSFASNGILLPAPEHITAKSPGPVTAGPDLGRHNLSRMEIVGMPNSNSSKKSGTLGSNGNPRHSFNGTDMDLNFSSSSPPVSGHSYSLSTSEGTTVASSSSSSSITAPAPSRVNGHVRAGSAGNWGSFSRSSLSNASSGAAASAYQRGQSPAGAGDLGSSPWGNSDLTKGTSRLQHEKTTTWA